ncbi:MAG: PAS domain-containing protein, partial [Flavihumibacter sp.]|nr:PAS domain-containing protein [Flavihumibacter sp.]
KATSDTIWDWNIENDCISYNNGIYKMFGYDIIAVEKMSDWWKTNIHPDDRYRVNHLLVTAFKGQQETVQLQYRYRCANKTYKFILDRAFIIYNEAGKPVRVIGAMQDVSVEKQQEIIVGKAIIDAQERERQQIGMELHDNVTQILSAAQLYLELAATEYTDLNQVTKTIKSGKGFIADAITEIRRLSHQLAPASFKNVSLEEVFTSLINSMNSSQQFQVDMKFEQFEKELVSEDIQINLYRILQEQLHNIVKYAHPAKVSVRVVVNNNNIELTIIDDGKGFDTSNYQAGIGLKNIKRRANVFDGNFYINSSLGKGCELKVQLPLKRAS